MKNVVLISKMRAIPLFGWDMPKEIHKVKDFGEKTVLGTQELSVRTMDIALWFCRKLYKNRLATYNLCGKSRFEVINLDLNINSPSYFTQQYGVNDSVYRYCQKCYEYFKDKEYSEVLKTIGICPQCAPKDLYQEGRHKEMVRFIGNRSCAYINIRMDFDQYYNATDEEKVIIIKNTILKAVKKVRAKSKFDYESFSRDLQEIVNN